MIAPNTPGAEADSTDEPPPGGARSAGSRARPLVVGMALGVLAAMVTIAVYAFFTRDSTPRLTEEDYRAAVERWEKHGPADYDLDLELAGKRPGKIHVEVRGGEVVHMTRDGVEPEQKRTWDYWSVPGQLETIGQELEMARDPVASFKSPAITQMVMWAEFDPRLGYPRRYDRIVFRGDYEVHWRVTRFIDRSAKNGDP